MAIIDTTLSESEYLSKLERRFKSEGVRYKDHTVSKIKVMSLSKTARYGQSSDLLLTLCISRKTFFNHHDPIPFGDNIALLVERALFLKHRWFLSIVSEISEGNYYEHHDRQIDPNEDTVLAAQVLEMIIYVQKPIIDIATNIAYKTKPFSTLV